MSDLKTRPLHQIVASHAATSKIKSLAKTAEGALLQADSIHDFSNKLSALAGAVSLRINYDAHSSSFASELLNGINNEYKDIGHDAYQDGVIDFVNALKEGLESIESASSLTSFITLTGCNTPSGFNQGREVYGKTVTIEIGSLVISLLVRMSVIPDEGTVVYPGWCMKINSFDYTSPEAYRSMIDLFPGFAQALESEDVLCKTHCDLAKVEEVLTGQLFSSFHDINSPKLGVSADDLRNIIHALT